MFERTQRCYGLIITKKLNLSETSNTQKHYNSSMKSHMKIQDATLSRDFIDNSQPLIHQGDDIPTGAAGITNKKSRSQSKTDHDTKSDNKTEKGKLAFYLKLSPQAATLSPKLTETKRKTASASNLRKDMNFLLKTTNRERRTTSNRTDRLAKSTIVHNAPSFEDSGIKDTLETKPAARPSLKNNFILNDSRDLSKMIPAFLETCNVLRDREQENAKIAMKMKYQMMKIMNFAQVQANERDSKHKETDANEIERLRTRNRELEDRVKKVEEENGKLWNFISQLGLAEETADSKQYRVLMDSGMRLNRENGVRREDFTDAELGRIVEILEKQHAIITDLKRREAEYIKILSEVGRQKVTRASSAERRSNSKGSNQSEVFKQKNPQSFSKKELVGHKNSNMQAEKTEKIRNLTKKFTSSSKISGVQQTNKNEKFEKHDDQSSDAKIGLMNEKRVNNMHFQNHDEGSELSQENSQSDLCLYDYRELEASKKAPIDFVKEGNTMNVGGLKPQLKSMEKLKLNMGLVLKPENNEEPVGFHQEFMAQLDNFSQSWREAAQREKKP